MNALIICPQGQSGPEPSHMHTCIYIYINIHLYKHIYAYIYIYALTTFIALRGFLGNVSLSCSKDGSSIRIILLCGAFWAK